MNRYAKMKQRAIALLAEKPSEHRVNALCAELDFQVNQWLVVLENEPSRYDEAMQAILPLTEHTCRIHMQLSRASERFDVNGLAKQVVHKLLMPRNPYRNVHRD